MCMYTDMHMCMDMHIGMDSSWGTYVDEFGAPMGPCTGCGVQVDDWESFTISYPRVAEIDEGVLLIALHSHHDNYISVAELDSTGGSPALAVSD